MIWPYIAIISEVASVSILRLLGKFKITCLFGEVVSELKPTSDSIEYSVLNQWIQCTLSKPGIRNQAGIG